MDKELEEKLFEKYPVLLRGRNESIQNNLLPFGIATENGWFDLLDNLLSDLKEINEEYYGNKERDIKVVQIKEKFAELRCYINGGPEEAFDRIQEAEERSREICERCGSTENIETEAPHGWYRTLCEECWKKQLKKKKKQSLDTVNEHGETD